MHPDKARLHKIQRSHRQRTWVVRIEGQSQCAMFPAPVSRSDAINHFKVIFPGKAVEVGA